jgi:hypothetical protein
MPIALAQGCERRSQDVTETPIHVTMQATMNHIITGNVTNRFWNASNDALASR